MKRFQVAYELRGPRIITHGDMNISSTDDFDPNVLIRLGRNHKVAGRLMPHIVTRQSDWAELWAPKSWKPDKDAIWLMLAKEEDERNVDCNRQNKASKRIERKLAKMATEVVRALDGVGVDTWAGGESPNSGNGRRKEKRGEVPADEFSRHVHAVQNIYELCQGCIWRSATSD